MIDVVYLVRHAKAGNRMPWGHDDINRPLSPAGLAQARALADVLGPLIAESDGVLLSSPALRCVQTIEPLGARIGRPINTEPLLFEASAFGPVLDLIGRVPAGSVLSSHGDVIPDTIAALERRGVAIVNEPDWRKASIWVLRRTPDGAVDEAESWPPPLAG